MSGLVRSSSLIATALALAACGSSSSPAPTANLTQSAPPDVEDVSADGLTAAPDSIHDRESLSSDNIADETGR